ncbi:hypothetical protein MAR_034706 [Mya arenaria]|uniref:Uncharacterized protein n=1 Tax=Mya arenaria TaxID=6604 RepID=A0ABY7EIB5_MYAAR|nr:hypothetical protein MAR_034706 [Mya arenaria]
MQDLAGPSSHQEPWAVSASSTACVTSLLIQARNGSHILKLKLNGNQQQGWNHETTVILPQKSLYFGLSL